MAAQYYKINYKSDFVLTINSDAGWAVPFCIKFWTGMPSHGYFAGFDGENYVNCRVGETPTQLLVMFDDHHMPIGPLRMQIAYHTTIEEFPDRKFDEVTNPINVTVDIDGTEYQVMLDFTGETGAEIDFSMPSSGVMSVNGKIGYVTLNAEDVGAQPTIEDLATIRSGAAEGATAVQPNEMTAALATKQDTIPDLATIRSGAAAGATAYQKPGTGIPESDLASGVQLSLHKANAAAPQSNTYTKGEVDTLIAGAISDIDVDDALSTTSENPVQNKVVTTALNGKQATISDLSTIRSGAAAGATAVQPAALTPIENDIDAIEGKIPSAASTSNQLADKAFVNSALADKADTSDIPTALSQLSQDSTHRVVTDAEKNTWNGKQNAIDDLATIRSGAAAGATAVQPAAMNTALAAKQDTLTFDNAPTANSNNPVKSSGIKTALDAKQSTISTVNVTVDNNTGTPSGSASVSGSTLSLSFQNLKGATGATGATGPQGPQGERGLPGESGVTGDVSGFTVIQTIDPSATYGATDIAGAATVQATNQELTELEGEVEELSGTVEDVSKNIEGETLLNGTTHTYNNAGNWYQYINLSPGDYFWIKLESDAPIEVTFNTSGGYVTIATISDAEWYKLQIPSTTQTSAYGISLVLTNRKTGSVFTTCWVTADTFYNDVDVRFSNIEKTIEDEINVGTEMLGEGTGASAFNSSVIFTPCKKASRDGLLEQIYFVASADTTLTIYVGEVDQNLLLIPRVTKVVSVVTGTNTLDFSGYGIYVREGESVAFKTGTGGVKFNNATAGSPTSENSFMYSLNANNLFQLQVYGAQKIFKVAFYATIKSSNITSSEIADEKLEESVSSLSDSVSALSSQMGIVSDNQGNKYRLLVVNGVVQAIPLQYNHILVVGNSFTIHPTTTDVGSGFVSSVWWGHWAMAASAGEVAWTKLLQNGLRADNANAIVTPIFGRPYETGLYTIEQNDAFSYWDGTTRKSLKANLTLFTDVDCVVFFLGDNYTGSEWASRFETMYNQFAAWFPTARLICMSTVTKTDVNADIQSVARDKGSTYIDVYGIKTQAYRSRLGNFVKGDDNALHQIDVSSVGNHFGDNGQYLLATKVAPALGISVVDTPHKVTLNPSSLTLLQYNYLNGSIVSVFADNSVTAITVVDAQSHTITATQHAGTDYGNIFTFTMPNSDVVVSLAG